MTIEGTFGNYSVKVIPSSTIYKDKTLTVGLALPRMYEITRLTAVYDNIENKTYPKGSKYYIPLTSPRPLVHYVLDNGILFGNLSGGSAIRRTYNAIYGEGGGGDRLFSANNPILANDDTTAPASYQTQSYWTNGGGGWGTTGINYNRDIPFKLKLVVCGTIFYCVTERNGTLYARLVGTNSTGENIIIDYSQGGGVWTTVLQRVSILTHPAQFCSIMDFHAWNNIYAYTSSASQEDYNWSHGHIVYTTPYFDEMDLNSFFMAMN